MYNISDYFYKYGNLGSTCKNCDRRGLFSKKNIINSVYGFGGLENWINDPIKLGF